MPRTLVPYYFISTRLVGWQCSDCGQVFRFGPEDPVSSHEPLHRIREEFRQHNCDEHQRSKRDIAAKYGR